MLKKTPKCLVFSELAGFGAFLGAVLVMLVTRRIEIEALILVLLTGLRAGVPIMALNDKSRLKVAVFNSNCILRELLCVKK